MEDRVFIGVGSNIGNGVKNCMAAIKTVSSDARIYLKSISSFYTTSPVSDIQQDDFINCAILVSWKGTAAELLALLQTIESSMGRTRDDRKNGPRIIDLDILLFGDAIIDEPSLTVPHKELHLRKFALVPCIEIDPNSVIPTFGKSLSEFLGSIDESQIIRKLRGIEFLNEFEEQ
ncbi:MAG TPA: 2-amino-4-hydroxy-6-hydroxymethyldihydropteridine diphosphokinase [Syntrophorhabdaceae bacterium]|nr:2-amino-4-hydroxy-6-hydroxymethyldihydropteridine diphosphokinase [Syntrophorhabdaceae bacterium]